MAQPKYKLTYFNAKGWSEQSRFCFAYAGIPWEDVRLEMAEFQKAKSGFPWGTLPILEVDGKQLTQSKAILRYLGKNFNLAGGNEWEEAQCDEIAESLSDVHNASVFLYNENNEERKAEKRSAFLTNVLPKHLTKWNEIIGANPAGLLVGTKFTYADFAIACAVEFVTTYFNKDVRIQDFPHLLGLQAKVYSAPGIKEWIAKRPTTED